MYVDKVWWGHISMLISHIYSSQLMLYILSDTSMTLVPIVVHVVDCILKIAKV